MKQYRIDNGKIGGLIVIFMNSMVAVAPINFIGILALNYDKYIKYWIDIYSFIIVSTILFVIYEWVFFAYIYPSMMRFSNRQVFMDENPVMEKVDNLEKKIDILLNSSKNK